MALAKGSQTIALWLMALAKGSQTIALWLKGSQTIALWLKGSQTIALWLMAEKQDYPQSELFSPNTGNGHFKPHIPKNPFFFRIRSYEKAILLIMGLGLVSIISFSIGVENGKRVVLSENNGVGPDTYTIQVAVFKSKAFALRNAQFLTREGMNPMVFLKGNYIILCVGKFSNQESAQPLLAQLQRTYAGCRLRRL